MSRIAKATVFKSFCSRKSCNESFRPRSTMSLCNLRKPASCTRIYAEYATTTARVITKPKRSPKAGDRSEREGVCTDTESTSLRRLPAKAHHNADHQQRAEKRDEESRAQ